MQQPADEHRLPPQRQVTQLHLNRPHPARDAEARACGVALARTGPHVDAHVDTAPGRRVDAEPRYALVGRSRRAFEARGALVCRWYSLWRAHARQVRLRLVCADAHARRVRSAPYLEFQRRDCKREERRCRIGRRVALVGAVRALLGGL